MDNPEEIKLDDITITQSITPQTVIDIDDKVNAGIGPVIANVAQTAIKSGAINTITSEISNEITNNPKCSFLNNSKIFALLITLIGLGIGGLIEYLILKFLRIDIYDSQI